MGGRASFQGRGKKRKQNSKSLLLPFCNAERGKEGFFEEAAAAAAAAAAATVSLDYKKFALCAGGSKEGEEEEDGARGREEKNFCKVERKGKGGRGTSHPIPSVNLDYLLSLRGKGRKEVSSGDGGERGRREMGLGRKCWAQ